MCSKFAVVVAIFTFFLVYLALKENSRLYRCCTKVFITKNVCILCIIYFKRRVAEFAFSHDYSEINAAAARAALDKASAVICLSSCCVPVPVLVCGVSSADIDQASL